MDIDSESIQVAANAVNLSTFNATFPLPYRVLLLAGIGIACWATNVHILYLLGIDASYALDIRRDKALSPHSSTSSPSRQSTSLHMNSFAHPATLYPPLYKLLLTYSAWFFVGWSVFRYATQGDAETMDHYKIYPIITFLGALFALLCPFNLFQKQERAIFLRSVRRCLALSYDQPVYFSDIILADIFTSYAKVIGDLWISTYSLWPGGSLARFPDSQGLSSIAVPLLMCFPYLVRFRQCMSEYAASKGTSNRSLFNAVKYATAFPVIFFSAAQRFSIIHHTGEKEDHGFVWHSENHVFKLWLLAVFINSAYSFWWDVTNDWGFDLLLSKSRKPHSLLPSGHAEPRVGKLISAAPSPNMASSALPTIQSNHPNQSSEPRASNHDPNAYPYGLRRVLLFRDPLVYYLAIILNLVLRFTWSLKLSTHLHSISELESGVFLMEALELIRRWMWVFVRVEWESVKKGHLDERGDSARNGNELELILFSDDSTSDEKASHRPRQLSGGV